MNNSHLLYVTDPLCLWCYGISSNIEDFQQQLPENIAIETINGGLFPGDKAQKCERSFRDYLFNAAKRVTELSGKKFSDKFWALLATPNFFYDTQPSAMATVTIKHFCGESKVLEFSHALQYAFFVDGKNVMDKKVLSLLAEPFGIKQADFIEFYSSNECLDLTLLQYLNAKQLGVGGFPAMLYQTDNKRYSLCSGFTTLENLVQSFNWVENQTGQNQVNATNVCTEKGCTS